jgi:hypothetical protein
MGSVPNWLVPLSGRTPGPRLPCCPLSSAIDFTAQRMAQVIITYAPDTHDCARPPGFARALEDDGKCCHGYKSGDPEYPPITPHFIRFIRFFILRFGGPNFGLPRRNPPPLCLEIAHPFSSSPSARIAPNRSPSASRWVRWAGLLRRHDTESIGGSKSSEDSSIFHDISHP